MFRLGGICLLACAARADTNLFFNAFGPLGGRLIVGVEQTLTPRLEAVGTARYSEEELGLVTGLVAPLNVDRMFDLSGSLGLNYHPFQAFAGLYAGAEVEAGYHSTAMKRDDLPGPDSALVEGYFLAPAAKAGYRVNLGSRFSISPELGVSYKWNTADFDRLSESEATRQDDMPFDLSRKELSRANSGWHGLAALNLAFRF